MKRIACARPLFEDVPAILDDMAQVLQSGRLMLGPFLERFETDFARYVGTRYAIGVNSCTTALEIALRFAGAAQGEVIVPTSTFVASANAVLYAEGRPVFVDADPATLCINRRSVEAALSDRTVAVVYVHLGGHVWPEVLDIRELCLERGLTLIEDCAHAHGASLASKQAGAFGLAGCFSFYPTKIMTTGTGGMITTDDQGLAEFARSLRLHGRGDGSRGGLDAIVNLGNDWFLDELGAVLGVHQLAALDRNLERRRHLAKQYLEGLVDTQVRPIMPHPACRPSYYKFMALLESAHLVDYLKASLIERHGIETESLYYPPCHLQPVYREKFGFKPGDFPVAEDALSRQLCLPLHAAMSEDDVTYVVQCVQRELVDYRSNQ